MWRPWTASPLPILGKGRIERANKGRRHRPILMIDLDVPRDVEAEVAELDDVFLDSVDDLGKIVQEGLDTRHAAVAQAEAMGLKLGATAGFRPTDTDFNAHVAKLQDAKCDLVIMGTIVKDTVIILQTARKTSFNTIFCGNFAPYSTAVAEAPGEPAEGFYSMAPALYRYPDDPTPKVKEFCEDYRKRFGIDVNYLGEAGYTAATFMVAVLDKVGRDLTLDSLIAGREGIKDWHDIFGGPARSLSPTRHHASSQQFLQVGQRTRWPPGLEHPRAS